MIFLGKKHPTREATFILWSKITDFWSTHSLPAAILPAKILREKFSTCVLDFVLPWGVELAISDWSEQRRLRLLQGGFTLEPEKAIRRRLW